MKSDYIEVNGVWYKKLEYADDISKCPYCDSLNLIESHQDSKLFLPRIGCLDCDKWLTPVEFKEKG